MDGLKNVSKGTFFLTVTEGHNTPPVGPTTSAKAAAESSHSLTTCSLNPLRLNKTKEGCSQPSLNCVHMCVFVCECKRAHLCRCREKYMLFVNSVLLFRFLLEKQKNAATARTSLTLSLFVSGAPPLSLILPVLHACTV